MGCCLSKKEENQDMMFDPNEYEEIRESDQNPINEARQLAERIETHRSEDLKILDETHTYPGPSPHTEIIGDFYPQEIKTNEGKVVFKAVRKSS